MAGVAAIVIAAANLRRTLHARVSLSFVFLPSILMILVLKLAFGELRERLTTAARRG